MQHGLRRRWRLLLGGAALTAGLLAGPFMSDHALAAYTVCSSDPVVTLSNGHQLTLQAVIGTDISNVTAVNYRLHIPVDLRVTDVQYDQFGSLEHLTWVADESGSAFEDDTTVLATSAASGTSVTAWASFPNGDNTYSVNGQVNQTLTIQWRM
jgi:hypothetical protein